jgi:hypothetical protein
MWYLAQFRPVDQINTERPLHPLIMKVNSNVSEALTFEAAIVPSYVWKKSAVPSMCPQEIAEPNLDAE